MIKLNSNNSHQSPLLAESSNQNPLPLLSQRDAEKYTRLKAKSQVPYKGLR
ncbi:MAG: hypothetical protein ACTMUB_03730 [cyanobacterium endosymbiont of Rhopalodia musculus]|uniref:hypothetical protein n=1 Tax=cyanobacterium endosymbiont of Epithemia clementina EcSB TaxID=3034674 RepID=UPI002480531C|nr:hypothetical protein [cyanobacterium endosymbiont of Epithemia clementina EcSB]WGT67306.1 hypothetical protein P3F56_08875 [cyanobacterium endosymbiont of Epithemia clementina EcSB]